MPEPSADNKKNQQAPKRPKKQRGGGGYGLWARYRSAWNQAWNNRKLMETPRRLPHEVQFLPAAQELQDTPVNPLPHAIIWTIVAFAVIAVSWAYIGKIEVVAVATGKIVVSGDTKTIASSETAVVKAIHVDDGQSVKAGDVLIELDPTTAVADVGKLKADLLAARIDYARAKGMLSAIDTKNNDPKLPANAIPGATPVQLAGAQNWLSGQYAQFRSQVELADAEITQRSADLQAAKAQVATLEKTLPIVTGLAQDYQKLLKQQYVPRHAYLEKEQTRLDVQRQLNVQRSTVAQNSAALNEAKERRQNTIASTRKDMLDLLQQSKQTIDGLRQQLTKAQYLSDIRTLKAPVNGTVQQLAVHTVGGVVTPGTPLMVIVPSSGPVEVDAMLDNMDVGFVHEGQEVTVKIDTFNYNKYGVVKGVVTSLSKDAIEDEQHQYKYAARVHLDTNKINVGDRWVSLTPGMTVRAEIKTDQRRVISYFLSPLHRYLSESIRER